MTEPNGSLQLLALCEFPLQPAWLEGLVRAAGAAGLQPSRVPGDGQPLGLGGPGWELTFPAAAGYAHGCLPPALLASWQPLIDFVGTLGDVCRSDWCLLDPAPPPLPAAVPGPQAPAPLPGAARVLYLSADFAHQLDLVALTQTRGLRIARSVCGAMILRAEPQAVGLLAPLLAPLQEARPRPPARPADASLPAGALVRPAFPGLGQWQRHMAVTVWSWCFGAAPAEAGFPDIHHLVRLEAALLTAPRPLPVEVLESWSALAGEVVVAAGGRWCRILHPEIGFPESMAVAAGAGLFRPHAKLMADSNLSPAPSLAQAVAGVLSAMGSNPESSFNAKDAK